MLHKHQRQIDQALQTIEQAMTIMRAPYVACSWGKDSVMTLWLVLQVRPETPVIYLDSRYALPDTYTFRDRVLAAWEIARYTEVPAEEDYIALCRRIGLPHERTPSAQAAAVAALKKSRGTAVAKEHGYDGVFWGLRAEESIGRRGLLRAKGLLFLHSDGLWRCAPIGWWRASDLWSITEALGLPINPIYTKTRFQSRDQIRNTGWLSTDGAERGQIAWLRYYYPDLFNCLAAEFPEVRGYV